jgi:hypothetical protein
MSGGVVVVFVHGGGLLDFSSRNALYQASQCAKLWRKKGFDVEIAHYRTSRLPLVFVGPILALLVLSVGIWKKWNWWLRIRIWCGLFIICYIWRELLFRGVHHPQHVEDVAHFVKQVCSFISFSYFLNLIHSQRSSSKIKTTTNQLF